MKKKITTEEVFIREAAFCRIATIDGHYKEAYRKSPERLEEIAEIIKATASVWDKEKW
jgi:hypothetical protein